MFYDSGVENAPSHSIRNANSASANGGFSTAGPCGGSGTWGGSSGNQYTEVAPGDKVTMKINYNGGHKSDANEFAVRWKCGARNAGPSENEMESEADLAAGVCEVLSCPEDGAYPCPAPEGNSFEAGYIFACTVPTENANMDCTYSVLDQRDWGGCVDLRVGEAETTTTLPEATDPVVPVNNNPETAPTIPFPQSAVGDYKFYSDHVLETSPLFPNCCCTMDIGTEDKNNFNIDENGRLTGKMNIVCPQVVSQYKGVKSSSQDLDLQMTMVDGQWTADTSISGQDMSFYIADNMLNYVNVDPEEPMICDGWIMLDYASTAPTAGNTYQADTQCEAAQARIESEIFNNASSFGIFVIAAVLLAFL